MPRLTISDLEGDCLTEAYPLIRCLAGVEQSRWTSFAELLLQEGGILVARVEDDRIYGVAGYTLGSNLKYGKVLRVEVLVAIELGHAPLVRDALSSAIEKRACQMDCSAVVYRFEARGLLSSRSKKRRSLEQAGLSAESLEFVRHVAGRDASFLPG